MTPLGSGYTLTRKVSTHMPLARHDLSCVVSVLTLTVSTHMPLARHDHSADFLPPEMSVSTHMPLARHDENVENVVEDLQSFYSHASCEA